jgi:hydroxylamine reductase
MFCYQCQEAAKNAGCTIRGLCGKDDQIARLQDLLVYAIKGIAQIVVKGKIDIGNIPEINLQVLRSLSMTLTNANFDGAAIEKQIKEMMSLRNKLRQGADATALHDAAIFEINPGGSRLYAKEHMLYKARLVGVLATKDEDLRSLRETIIYAVKGMAAYLDQALHAGKEDFQIYAFIYEALAATLDDCISSDDLVALALKSGEYGLKAMALVDQAYTAKYGHPEITRVNIGVRNHPAILISGDDLTDLEQLLEQTRGTGVDVYTHGDMLAAHHYPAFKTCDNLAGNYGNSWCTQAGEFKSFHGPILFNSNCIMPLKQEELKTRVFTTGFSGFPGCAHIVPDVGGKKDFSSLIELAKTLPGPEEIQSGSIEGGYARHQLAALANRLADAIDSGTIKKVFFMPGWDGLLKSRRYYTEFARKLPGDTVILTAGCAKYRFNKLELGNAAGLPRVLDAGQLNDSYSLMVLALKLQAIMGLDDINKLPFVYNIAWFEQKTVTVLLALLYLGVKNIHQGPTLPAFLSRNVAQILTEEFGIKGITTVDDDIAMFMAE